MRDDFKQEIKETLAKRVAFVCSNPECNMSTIGPNSEQGKSTNIGVAAHITAASKGGKRYDETLSAEQRSSIDNGIWLCQTCSKLIDTDEKKYTIELLKKTVITKKNFQAKRFGIIYKDLFYTLSMSFAQES